MSGGYIRWIAVIFLGLALALMSACEREQKKEVELQPCAALDSDSATSVCRSFSETFAETAGLTKTSEHLVFRSYCDGAAERITAPVSGGQVDRALAGALDQRFAMGEVSDNCVFVTELLSPREGETAWAAMTSLDEYAAHRDGLVIRREPVEAVTPLDFAVVRPGESSEALSLLPHIYRRQARDADFLAEDAPVQLQDVHGFVLRDELVSQFRYHRVRQTQVNEETLTQGVRRAAQWFQTMRDEDKGRFYYEYDPYSDTHVDEEYNLLRHAGSSWAIMQAYGLTRDETFRELGEYALAWVENHSRTEKKQGRTIRFVVEPWNNKAKLGGAGLWLLALSEHARLTGDTSNLKLMQQIANYIYLAQEPETGKFESFHATDGVFAPDFDSDYYPGEAMFALHRARPFISDIPVCEVTKKGLEHMLQDEPRKMAAEEYRFVNQWNAYTIREYRRDCADKQFDWVWRRDLEHMLATASTLEDAPVMAGAYQQRDGDFSTSPTRLEALTTICAELGREDAAVARRCAPVVRRVAGMQLTLQHSEANSWLWPNPDAVEGGFAHALDNEAIRIDFTQHHMSAMYNAIDFLRHVPADQNTEGHVRAEEASRSFPFNLVGEATCQQVEGVKCL